MTSVAPKIDTQSIKGKQWFQAYGCGVVTVWRESEELARADWASKVAKCSG